MTKNAIKRIPLLVSLFLFSTVYSFAQQQPSTCKVLLKEISGTYSGECNDSLANGKGTAKGEDSYVGTFKNGLPDGKGTYTYNNGNVYSGEWSNGLKSGKGKFKYSVNGKTTTLVGFWKDGEYAGPSKPADDYRITNISGIENYSIKRTESSENVVLISFEKVMRKYIPGDLDITITSGNKVLQNLSLAVFNYTCPFTCSMHFVISTAGGNRECNFGFEIFKPGKYEVFISNN